ncbi:MAG: MBL fold metallo-hydrolase [Gammaproteobacteria bacterium]|nr:MBL fold metallo-hydrolase [Gammaproteobacteria bacterium]
MKMTIVVLCSLFLAGITSLSAASGTPVRDYPFEKVAENTWVIHGPLEMPNVSNQGFMNNPGIVLTNEGVVIVDPGSSVQAGEMVLRMLEKVSDQLVIAVFNTHIHGDHWLGNQAIRTAYPDAPIYGHVEMLAMVDAGSGDTWVELMERLTEGATKGTKVVGPNHAVKHGDSFKIGNKTFRIHHHGQAHTRTDIMIEIEEDGVVFLGDNVTADRIPRMSDGNFMGNIGSVDKILGIEAKTWVPGHGPTGDAAMVKAYRDYLQAVYSSAEKAFNADLDSSDVKAISLQATIQYKGWAGYENELGPHGAQAYMEVEAAEF